MAKVIDSHQHFWNLKEVSYPWLLPAYGPIYATFRPEDLEPMLKAVGVDGTVLVQAANGFEDTRAMLENAARFGWIEGVVGWLPLTEPRIAERALEVFTPNPKFRGIRHLIHDEPDPDYLLKAEVGESLKLLASQDLTFDVVSVLPRHLEHLPTIAGKVPSLKIVIDHLSKPPIKDGGWQPWADLLAQAAEHPNVYAKISGLNTAADWENWRASDLEPYVEHALKVFGPKRLMFGSDWPVALLAGDYAKVWQETNLVLDHLAPEHKDRLLGLNAAEFYGIGGS